MKKFFATTVLALIPTLIFAGGGHPPTPVKGPGGPPGTPIDQYLYILLAVGVLLLLFFPKLVKSSK